MVPRAGVEPARHARTTDFKSVAFAELRRLIEIETDPRRLMPLATQAPPPDRQSFPTTSLPHVLHPHQVFR